ncbi:MAG TPA: S53 family peptidase [Bryobacteraceae bacterium]|jgi:subtilase family serine protease|nr:S53 family peptidase [Bryobacteraceae bacterium]
MKFEKALRLLLFSGMASVVCPSIYAQSGAYAVMPTPIGPGMARSFAWVAWTANPNGTVRAPGQTCGSAQNVCYYLPSDITTAYATGSIASANGGAGITVAIVDAFYNSQTEADLLTYTSGTGLPTCSVASGCLTIVNQTGASCTPTPTVCSTASTFDAEGWALETDLDVQAVHAIAPNAHILLVTATNDSNVNLYAAVQYAYAHADVVTDSWGGNEQAGDASEEGFFSPSTVPILFSAGDAGAVTEYPCTSANVLCVGGTHLISTAASFRNVESAWGGSDTNGGGGGGCSSQITAPSFQSGFSTTDCGTARGVPDVSALADPYTGLAIAVGSFAALGLSSTCTPTICPAGTYVIGGTSLASPLTAGVIALVDADRVAHSKAKLGSNLNALVYQAASASYRYRFYDVTTGTNGFAAATGWDEATGLGVILGPALATYLISLP